MGFKDFYSSLPLLKQVPKYQFYTQGYTEALGLFSGVRVVLSEEWLSGVPADLQDYFFRVKFPCFFIPVFTEQNCYGFVVKGFSKQTPRFCTNALLPGCERIRGGELVILCEGLKDAYLPMVCCKDLPVVVIPMLTAVPSKDFLGFLKTMGCTVLYVPDNDEHRGSHQARFYELIGSVGLLGSIFHISGHKDFGDFFSPALRSTVLESGRMLRESVKALVTY